MGEDGGMETIIYFGTSWVMKAEWFRGCRVEEEELGRLRLREVGVIAYMWVIG